MNMAMSDDLAVRREIEYSSNAYEIVSGIAKTARKMCSDYDNMILQSQAISHAAHGTEPDLYDIQQSKDEYEARVIKEEFCYIDDVEVKHAVYDSFYASKAKNNLVYVYNDIKSESKKSRVRIITRMLYHKLIG